jgi:hypothetical protein
LSLLGAVVGVKLARVGHIDSRTQVDDRSARRSARLMQYINYRFKHGSPAIAGRGSES